MRIAVTGAGGFLGGYVAEELTRRGHEVRRTGGRRSHDLRFLEPTRVAVHETDVVVHCAAAVGGIGMNLSVPAQMYFENAQMGQNIIHASYLEGVRRVVVIGTACEYPAETSIPTVEEELWDGYPAFDTAPYALAKKGLLVMGEAYHDQYGLEVEHVIPSNLYGPHDNFDPDSGHVIPGMIVKFSRAQERGDGEVQLWGTGLPTRDFLHVTDAARGIAAVAERGLDGYPINLGSGRETRISELAQEISEIYGGEITPRFTGAVSDGVSRRLLSTARAWNALEWAPIVRLEEGLRGTVAWYEDWDL